MLWDVVCHTQYGDTFIARIDGKEGHQRHPHSCRPQSLDRGVVVRAEDEVRLDAAGAEMGLDLGHAATLAKANRRQAGDLSHPRSLTAHDERRIGGNRQDVRITQQFRCFKWARVQRQHGKGEVQLSPFHQRQEFSVVRGLG